MNIYNEYHSESLNEEKKKSTRTMKILAVAIVVLFVMSMYMIYYISYVRNKQLKVFVDGAKIQPTADMIIHEDGNVYISVNDIAEKIGYRMNNGEYKNPYSEDITKCYLSNKYETASYIVDTNEIYKAIIPEKNVSDVDYEYFTIDKNVIFKNNKIYTTLDGLSQGCNLSCSYEESKNTVRIYTLDYLAQRYTTQITGAEKVFEKDNENSYRNKKAILYNMMIVQSEDGKYGVSSLDNNTVIGQKYKSITFMEQSQEFMVQTENDLWGIITYEGATKIQPEYTSIKQIDKDRGLYLVSQNSSVGTNKVRYGIVNKNDRVVIHIEFEKIGIDKNSFSSDSIDNPYILYEKCIPVKRSNKWGLLDINGNVILPIEYEDLGCLSNSSTSSQASTLLLVPEYEAVVVKKASQYGLFNSSGEELIPVPANVLDMYGVLENGKRIAYLTYKDPNGVIYKLNIIEYLKNVLGIEPVVNIDSNNNNANNTNNNANNNTNNNINNNNNNADSNNNNNNNNNNTNNGNNVDNNNNNNINKNVQQ